MALGDLSDNVFLSIVYTVLGGVLGLFMMGIAAFIVPRLVDMLTPNIDEEKEMLRGNLAVATYSGKVTQAVIIGVSIIVAAAIIAGI